MSRAANIRVCFAVKEEANPFRKHLHKFPNVAVVLTGMGRTNAERAIRSALASNIPECVISSGFAGGLDPALALGDLVWDADDDFDLIHCASLGHARRVRFHCADRVIATAVEKRQLWNSTAAHVVEMESSVIRAVCRERSIPSAIFRIISDTADEDLALDFNQLMTSDYRLSYSKLARVLFGSPRKVIDLVRFQRRIQAVAEKLARDLSEVLCSMKAK